MGAVIIPALALFSYIFGVGLIDDLIGQYASRRHGYIFLIVFTYPFWAIIYFIVVWAIDYNYKHKLRSENYNIKGFAKQFLKTLAIILVIILVSSFLLFCLSLVL